MVTTVNQDGSVLEYASEELKINKRFMFADKQDPNHILSDSISRNLL